jgi:hypothetical protein
VKGSGSCARRPWFGPWFGPGFGSGFGPGFGWRDRAIIGPDEGRPEAVNEPHRPRAASEARRRGSAGTVCSWPSQARPPAGPSHRSAASGASPTLSLARVHDVAAIPFDRWDAEAIVRTHAIGSVASCCRGGVLLSPIAHLILIGADRSRCCRGLVPCVGSPWLAPALQQAVLARGILRSLDVEIGRGDLPTERLAIAAPMLKVPACPVA